MIYQGTLYIFLAGFLWALDTLVRYPLVFSGIDISQIVFWEHLLLSAAFFPYIKSSWSKVKSSKLYIFLFILLGCGGSAAATLMFTKAFSLAHPTIIVLIQKTQPIFALILARFWLNEKFPKKFFFFALLAFVGGLLLIGEDIMNLKSQSFEWNSQVITGYIYALLASILWGGSTVVGRYLVTHGFKEKQMTTLRVNFACFFFLPIIAIKPDILMISFDHIKQVSLLSLLSGILGLMFYYKGLKSTKARLATFAEMTFPIWVIGLNWAFLSKKVSLIQLGGAIILFISIYWLQKDKNQSTDKKGLS